MTGPAIMNETVLLLGASGSMGFEAFRDLWNRRDASGQRRYDVVLLLRPSKKNKEMFEPYESECGIESIPGSGCVDGNGFRIIWGDATVYEDTLSAVRGADWVLCPMAFISPAADRDPEMSEAVNTTAIRYIIKAIYEVGGEEHIKLIYIGSVAETGDRLQEIHMGRVGDPLKPSVFDFYATCKIAGERAVIESGLKYWASLRQTYIAVPDTMSLIDPIMFHQPIDTCIEFNTSRDAGRGLVNCLDVPEVSDFWKRVYNMAGGPSCRAVYLHLMRDVFRIVGLDYRKILERRWFALRNFHCQYFEDSGILNEYIHNWGDTIDDYFGQVNKNLPLSVRLSRMLVKVPGLSWLIHHTARRRMRSLALAKDGPLHWYQSGNDLRISAFYGSFEAFESIGNWDDEDMPNLSPSWRRLDHGYDENKEVLEIGDLVGAAQFRGGSLVSSSWAGDLYSKLRWTCAFGHEFEATPYLVLKTGHWCPQCAPPPWDYGKLAKRSPFFAQIWYPNHSEDEDRFYPSDCHKDIL
jgi:nucleoside-diphosphate-sugar epimerase